MGRQFDTWDVVAFALAFILGLVVTAVFSEGASYRTGGGIGFGLLGLRLKNMLFPTEPNPSGGTRRKKTTARGISGAICLAFGMVAMPLSGLACAILVVRELAMLDGRGVVWLITAGAVFTIGILMLRYARSVGHE